MRVLVTGAAGFLGRALLRTLASRSPDDEITALDVTVPSSQAAAPGQISWLSGAVDDREVMEKAGLQDFDIIYHVVSVPGALVEREPALGRRVNLDATLDLFDRLAASDRRPRVVYASSVAVYGDLDGQSIGAHSPTRPTSTYGTHKRMAEMALADHSRRGGLSGIALRLPGLIARHGKATGFGSAFMSELPRAYAAAEPYVCPVSERATAWWMSVSCAASNLARAASIDVCGELQLPALRLSVAEIVDALSDLFGPDRRALISFNPDQRIEALFGRFPELATAKEEALGCPRRYADKAYQGGLGAMTLAFPKFRLLDLSVVLSNNPHTDPPGLGPQIEYADHKQGLSEMLRMFPGLKADDLPDGEAWGVERLRVTAHNGTHIDTSTPAAAWGGRRHFTCLSSGRRS